MWDQNLLAEWHIRYRGDGIVIYRSVEKNAACIYFQLKSCSSPEVAAMIQGLLRHGTITGGRAQLCLHTLATSLTCLTTAQEIIHRAELCIAVSLSNFQRGWG